ncbi:MAG: helicase HerA domain-containing protein [Chlorobaculum sp.]
MKAPEERLGSFYLGAEYDLQSGSRLEQPVHYDARDLTTHAVCVGMTGSGKTGLCIDLLEEAALDKVPVILVDPKGDMTNLLLQFPDLSPEDFLPWIDQDEARRKGQSPEELAAATASMWKNGLADWGIAPERIRELKDSAEFTIYTPGSDAGIPVNILGSLAAPRLDFDTEAEAIRERIAGTVSALLGLVGINADPVKSRESILLSGIFEHFWRAGTDLDLATLIGSIQNPPMRQIGVFDVNTFYPEKERFELAMSFNALLASPSFQSWLSGQALDIASMLYTADARPRVAIFSLAHLPENERMFFVTLLLENVLTWTRAQQGTSSLRALLYFDEVFGYLPPVSEPPSKRPLMTMLKQARAFGVGCVLVTQNPVDLDYKALTNTGTWFIGKLQAERDKARVLEGLKSAISTAGGSDAEFDFDTVISQLGKRVFLMHNVHEDRPVIFQTRWAMSFLSGPMTRPQIKTLMAGHKNGSTAQPATASPRPASPAIAETPATPSAAKAMPSGYSAVSPGLDPSIKQLFVPAATAPAAALAKRSQGSPASAELLYEPALIGCASVDFVDAKRGINENRRIVLACTEFDAAGNPDWEKSQTLVAMQDQLSDRPDSKAAGFATLPETLVNARKLAACSRSFSDFLYRRERLPLSIHPATGLFKGEGESERDFTIRLQQAAREQRDNEVDALEKKYATQLERIAEKIKKEERELAQDEAEHQNRKAGELIGLGETMLGFFLGRKSTRGISTAINRRRMTANAKAEVDESVETIEELKRQQEEIEAELKGLAAEITARWEHPESALTTEEIAPRRSDVMIQIVTTGWLPFWQVTLDQASGGGTLYLPAYEAADES